MTSEKDIDAAAKPLIEHLVELRRRLLWCFAAILAGTVVCFIYAEPIFGFLVRPLAKAMGPDSTNRLIYTDLSEAFFTYMRVAVFGGVFLTFPVLLAQLWLFISPGLYKSERKVFSALLLATPGLFFLGAAFVYYVIFPMAWPFFLSFQSNGMETSLPIQLEARVSEYLGLSMTMIFAFGLCFELPVLLVLLAHAGFITADDLASKRRYAILVAFVLAAFLTPPDVLSQFMLAIPLVLLYEISIFLVRRMQKNVPAAAAS